MSSPLDGWDERAVRRLIANIRNPERLDWEELANRLLHDPWRCLFPTGDDPAGQVFGTEPEPGSGPMCFEAKCDTCPRRRYLPSGPQCECGGTFVDTGAPHPSEADWDWGYGFEKGDDDA